MSVSIPHLRSLLCSLALLPFASLPVLAEEVRIGLVDAYPPYVIHETGEPRRGFDVDIITEICARREFSCSFEINPLADLLTSVQDGTLDIIIGGIGATEERAEMAHLTCPHMFFTARPDPYFSARPGRRPEASRIAVLRDSIHHRVLQELEYNAVALDTAALAIQAVINEEADLYFGVATTLDLVPGAGRALKQRGTLDMPPAGISFMVTPEHPDLRKRIDDSIAELLSSGFIADVHRRYGGFNPDFTANTSLTRDCLKERRG